MEKNDLAIQIEGLKASGMSWAQIAQALDITPGRARHIYRQHDRARIMPTQQVANENPQWGGEAYEKAKAMDVPEWIEFLKTVQGRHEELDPMRTHMKRVIKTDKPIAIQFVSCWHLGSRFAEYDQFREYFDRLMSTERFYWGIHGDEMDNFGVGFPSAEAVWSQVVPPKFQRELVRAIAQQIGRKRKALYACWSNHPGFDERNLGENLIKSVYREAGIPYFDGKGTLELTVGKQTYLLYVAHMFSGSSQWSKNASQARALYMEMPSADVVAMGDKHVAGIQKVYHHLPEFDAGRRVSPITYLVQTGTAKSGPDPYSIRNWTRGLFEWPVLCFYPDKHLIKIVDDIDDLEYFLKIG